MKCIEFLTNFVDPTIPEDPIHGKRKYLILMQGIANKDTNVLNIELDDLSDQFSSAKDSTFVDRIRANTMRYVTLFSHAVDQNMPPPTVNFRED